MTRRRRSARPTLLGVLAAGGLALAVSGTAVADDAAYGEELFHLCGTCHGAEGEGNLERKAPRIAGLPAWYVDAQLKKFEAGHRAYHHEDEGGLQMKPMARYVNTDERRAAVIAYLETLEPAAPAATVVGDAESGKVLYTPCTACHGADGKGNEALKAPALVGQSDWYLEMQLHKFKDGVRGAHPKDVEGGQMRAMTMTLTTDQAVKDVVAYITSLAGE